MSDGSRKLEINGMKVRYRDGNKLKKYNNNFKKISVKDRNELKKIHKTDENILKNDAISRYKYVNVSGDSKQYFPEVYDKETGIIMEKEDMTISFKPLFQNNKIIHYNKMNDNIISYYDEIDNIEYKYTSLNNAVKEDIIIREKPNYNYFEFEVRLHNMMMEEDEYSKAINIIHLDTKKKIAYIEEPNIKDNNEINYDDIEYELKKLIVNTI